MKRIAAIDIGSNAIRECIVEVKDNFEYKVIHKKRTPIRLGDEAFTLGILSEDTINECLDIFGKMRNHFESEKVELIRAVATSALRGSKNSKEFVRKIFNKTGIVINIIDGLHEAKLIYKAVKKEVDICSSKALLMDLGGGSLELTALYNGRIVKCHTFKLGALRLQHLQTLSEEKMLSHIEHKKNKIIDFLEDCFESNYDQLLLVGTGGNPRRMGKLRKKFLGKSSSCHVLEEELDYFQSEFKSLEPSSRAEKFELRTDRADVILPAIDVFKMMMKLVNVSRIELPKAGLINGIFEDVLGSENYRVPLSN